jgi:hypothetical protein
MQSRFRRVVCGLSLAAPLVILCWLWLYSTRTAAPPEVIGDTRTTAPARMEPAASPLETSGLPADDGSQIPVADHDLRLQIGQLLEREARAHAGAGDLLPPDFLDRTVRGNAVGFDLPDGSTAHGTVDGIERDDHGILAVHGRLTAPNPGTFLLQRQTAAGVAGPFVGHIRFDDSSEGWKIEPTHDLLSARFVPRHIDEILCVNLAAPPPEMAENSEEHDDPQHAPQTHPTNIPIPHYQPVIPLQSLPGATGVIYLDFDGEKGPFPGWGSFDAAPANATNTQIYEVWRRVCEDFQGFNLNITTDRKVFDNAAPGRRQQVIITPTKNASPSAGGVAFLNSYNWTTARPCWAYSQTGKSAAEVISHEVGHTLGLSHDGRTSPSETYYAGHGTDPVGWAPIMGVGYSKNLTQWSKGEYLNANRTQDDLTIIANNNNNVGYRPDDCGDTLSGARYLEILSNNSVSNEGIIERTGDIDAFRFQTSGGSVNLAVNPVSHGPNLDIHAEILDAQTLAVVVENNPLNALNATLATSLSAGEYLLRVRGTGRGDPLGDGYTNYGSLGTYLITGTVNGGVKPDRFTIAENSPNGSTVGTVTPRNNHGGAGVVFSISSGNTGGAFAINSTTGTLTVANSTTLNFETLSTRWDVPAVIMPFVTITNPQDPSLNETLRVVVNVSDVNEPPVIQTPSFTMLERTLPGTRLPALNASDPDRFQQLTFSIISGNQSGFFQIDANTGELTVASLIEVPQTTTLQLTVAATDSASPPLTTTTTASITVVKQTSPHMPGRIVRTFFENITGTAVTALTGNAKFPNNPDSERYLNAFDEGTHGENFGSTVRGYLIAPATGTYRFRIASDDSSQLLFSTTSNPASASVIASVSGSTDRYQWDKYTTQLSTTFNLTAGQVCYIEARHKESTVNDHVAVAWTTPLNASWQVIPGLYLAPFYQNYAPRIAATTFRIRENALVGQTVGHVTPSDANTDETFGAFTILSGNPDGVFGIDPASGRLFLAKGDSLDASAPPRVLTIGVTDGGTPALSGSGNITVQATPAGAILASGPVQQMWTGISGSTIASLTGNANFPYRPTSTRVLSGGFDSGTNLGDTYGSRIRAYVIAPQSGSYTFYLSTDDDGRLLMSTSASPSRPSIIAEISGWAPPGNWTKYPSQTSAPRSLEAGQKYYIEALHKEGSGGDHVQVAWTGPGISTPTLIPASALEPFDINMPPVFAPVGGPFAAESAMTPGTLIATVSANDPEGDGVTYAITSGDPNGAFAIAADGRITLENPAALENVTYPLTVTAQDAGIGGVYPLNSSTVNVAITASGAPVPLAAPVFSPMGGSYPGPLAVTLTSPDGADIVYTTDGSDPLASITATTSSSPASVVLTTVGTTTLRTRAHASDMPISPETSAVYQIMDDYESWSAQFPGTDLSDPDADFDGDGLSNRVERAFGLDPTNAASANPITVPLDATSGTISFTRRDPRLTGLTYRIWTSGDLLNWTEDAGAVLTPGARVDEVETVAVQLSQELLNEPALFVRVSAAAEP